MQPFEIKWYLSIFGLLYICNACFMQENKLVGIKYADFQFELLPEILILYA